MDVRRLLAYIDGSPSPFHACATAGEQLEGAGFAPLSESDPWPTGPGKHYLRRGGSLVAWATGAAHGPGTPFRIIGAHTDSPNLRVKPLPDAGRAGYRQLAVEVYGGALLNSWLDRDLGLSGRVVVRGSKGPVERLLRVDRPILRVPQLAIHLSAERKGVELDPQRHLNAIWSTGPGEFLEFVADRAGVARGDILGFELMAHDAAPSALTGARTELVSAPRLDNQVTCFAGLRALLDAPPVQGVRPVLALFDHEEVGSTSERGAQSDLLTTVLERIVLAAGGTRDDYHRAIASSICASGDMAHATHPNYAERHEALHHISIGGGPVLKVNVNLRYATDAPGAAVFAVACEQAGVELQRYEHRADLPCGSTIGPLSAARTGILTVDVGAPQLAMHSARELMGAADVDTYARALSAFLSPA